jgi:hypothetical protein
MCYVELDREIYFKELAKAIVGLANLKPAGLKHRQELMLQFWGRICWLLK